MSGSGLTVDALATIVAGGTIVDLSYDMFVGMPQLPRVPQYFLSLVSRHGDHVEPGGMSWANEIVTLCAHSGTHVDAMCHVALDGRLYGGADAIEAGKARGGSTAGGAETLEPIVGRGVLLDIAGLLGVDCLDVAHEVTVAELEAGERAAGTAVRAGDSILIRTGWGKHYEDAARFIGMRSGSPGPGLDGARWIASRGAKVCGSDTPLFELSVPGQPAYPGHRTLMAESGIPIIEALRLDALAAMGAGTFLFVLSPIRLRGATGAPARPLAIVLPSTAA